MPGRKSLCVGLMSAGIREGVEAGRRTGPISQRVDYVRRMFGAVAPRYDLTNTVISAGLHSLWKRQTIAALGLRPGEQALDICCGTGDLARLMAAAVGPKGRVVGLDFSAPMLVQAQRRRSTSRGWASLFHIMGDAMDLPLPANTFDAAAMGFGLRNVAEPGQVLREVRRVLRPGGRLAVLEFARVGNPILRWCYDLYSFTLMTGLGRLFSGHPDAYLYLPVSVRHWADQTGTLRLLAEAGFQQPTFRNLAGGIVAIYRAVGASPE